MAGVEAEGHARGGIDAGDRRIALWLIVGFAAIRFIGGHYLGLGVDEAYAVSVGRELSWGYFDHPPLTFWLARLSALIFGSEAHLVVRLPFLVLGTGSAVLVYLLTERLFGSRAGVWALASWSIAPFFMISASSWIVPDGPLQFFLLLAAWTAWPLFEPETRTSGTRWLWVGVAVGMALLSKYHAFLFAAGAFLFLASNVDGRRWLSTLWPYAAGLVALAFFFPVIWWNMENGWPSFSFQASRAGDSAGWGGLTNGIRLIGGEMLYLLPATLFIGVWAAWLAFRRGRGDLAGWYCLCLGAPIYAAFTLVAFVSERSLPHWPLPGFLFFMPLLGHWLAPRAEARPRSTRWSYIAGGAFTVLALTVLTLHSNTGVVTRLYSSQPPSWDDTTQIADWDAAADALESRGLLDADAVVAARNWVEAAKLDYALGDRAPVVVLNEDKRHFRYIAPEGDLLGSAAVLVMLVKPGRTEAFGPDALSGAFDGFCGDGLPPVIPWERGGVPYASFSVVQGRICQ